MLGRGRSIRKYTMVRGNLVYVRNPTFNTLEREMTPGNHLEVSRRLDLEGLVRAILRRADSGALPTMNCIKGKGLSWWKVGHIRFTDSGIQDPEPSTVETSLLLACGWEGKLPGQHLRREKLVVSCMEWWVGLYHARKDLGLYHEHIAFSDQLLLH